MNRSSLASLFAAALLCAALPSPAAAAAETPCPDLFIAIARHDNAAVKSLLASGINANVRNSIDISALMFAGATNNEAAADLLLAAGARLSEATTLGTALEMTAMAGHGDLALRLLEKGAEVKPGRPDRISALMYAARIGHLPLIRALISKGADLNGVDNHGSTALSYAAREGQLEAVMALTGAGARSDLADRDGWTPLMHAAMNGHAGLVKHLAAAGSGLAVKDKRGRTPLLLAASYGDYPEMVRALLAAGADPAVRDAEQRSAAEIAAARGYTASLAVMREAGMKLPAAETRRARTVREAARASLKRVEESMATFASRTGCISCHHEGISRFATAFARRHGYSVNDKVAQGSDGKVLGMIGSLGPLMQKALDDPEQIKHLPTVDLGDLSPTLSTLLLGLTESDTAPNPDLRRTVLIVTRLQDADGAWRFGMMREPVQSSFFSTTAMSIRAIKRYAGPESAKAVEESLQRARQWLQREKAVTTEDMVFRLLALRWAGARDEECATAAADLKRQQRPDGGWAQTSGRQSDAYATGTALYALHQGAGLPTADAIYRRGVDFLLRTQDADGAWYVSKRAMPANNYFDTGFPYGQSQYSSHLGACWATVALIQADAGSARAGAR